MFLSSTCLEVEAEFGVGVMAVAMVCPMVFAASASVSLLGRFSAGFALNIGTSGILFLVTVPTIYKS